LAHGYGGGSFFTQVTRMSEYSNQTLRKMAVFAVNAKAENDHKYSYLVLTIGLIFPEMSVEEIEIRIEEMANGVFRDD
jgi:hypothetical protein